MSLLVVVAEGISDQACQNFDREALVFVVQSFPGGGFVEKKIEQAQILFLQWSTPSLPGISCCFRRCMQRGG